MADIFSVNANLLVAFAVLTRERSVTRAARRFGVSQSAMSGLLAQLRQLFDDPLLVRAGNSMLLTPKAEALARKVCAGVTESSLSGHMVSGCLVVSTPQKPGHLLLVGCGESAGGVGSTTVLP